jgi:hypothetical protein
LKERGRDDGWMVDGWIFEMKEQIDNGWMVERERKR